MRLIELYISCLPMYEYIFYTFTLNYKVVLLIKAIIIIINISITNRMESCILKMFS